MQPDLVSADALKALAKLAAAWQIQKHPREQRVAKNSKIEWTTHTFNPWWGCVKMSPACKFCYAESWSKRLGKEVWGISAERRFFGDRHWSEPLSWNRQAEREGKRARVFCASMADVFEDRQDLDSEREKLWDLVERTPALDWLLLTKRPDRVLSTVPWTRQWPQNIWMGTTTENQEWANKRLAALAEIPAQVRFISAEPLLGPLELGRWAKYVNWVITGGESGPNARPSSPSWFRALMNECMSADIPFHFKQWGDWAPGQGENLAKVRKASADDGTPMFRVGKKAAGRLLDGEARNGLPRVANA